MAQYYFADPDVASLRVPVYTNEDGDIAVNGEDMAGSKNITFSYTKVGASATEIIHGVNLASDDDEITTTGIVDTFITYLLDAAAIESGMKRTIVQNTVYGNDPNEAA